MFVWYDTPPKWGTQPSFRKKIQNSRISPNQNPKTRTVYSTDPVITWVRGCLSEIIRSWNQGLITWTNETWRQSESLCSRNNPINNMWNMIIWPSVLCSDKNKTSGNENGWKSWSFKVPHLLSYEDLAFAELILTFIIFPTTKVTLLKKVIFHCYFCTRENIDSYENWPRWSC